MHCGIMWFRNLMLNSLLIIFQVADMLVVRAEEGRKEGAVFKVGTKLPMYW